MKRSTCQKAIKYICPSLLHFYFSHLHCVIVFIFKKGFCQPLNITIIVIFPLLYCSATLHLLWFVDRWFVKFIFFRHLCHTLHKKVLCTLQKMSYKLHKTQSQNAQPFSNKLTWVAFLAHWLNKARFISDVM